MPSITTVHESLPYIDPDPTPSERAAAEALIAQERALVPDDANHALLPLPPKEAQDSPFLTPLLTAELQRLASSSSSSPDQDSSKSKLNALDLSRYEAPDPPSPTTLSRLPASEASAQLQTSLARTYASHAYVASRRTHLALLDTYGKNAWLVGNYQLEGELKALEKELAETKREIDLLTLQRKEAQELAGPELTSLEETWKRGVGRVLETEAAAEALRREVLELRRRMAAAEH
ncbi:Pre-mRNA-splicing factor SPF27 [Chaetomium strumarium]|uniref:Pre-mRNA-splicing factor SPF27 n=1 Tax=Chaetomium strumarium TaxID=1170767 RepID=A0AAJ0GZJ6_9PEZI|nr:Pre-mRNA-splicing factor SPF27 [Chaetomium strumarium]